MNTCTRLRNLAMKTFELAVRPLLPLSRSLSLPLSTQLNFPRRLWAGSCRYGGLASFPASFHLLPAPLAARSLVDVRSGQVFQTECVYPHASYSLNNLGVRENIFTGVALPHSLQCNGELPRLSLSSSFLPAVTRRVRSCSSIKKTWAAQKWVGQPAPYPLLLLPLLTVRSSNRK